MNRPLPPALAQPLRIITQARVDSDGVSEAGLPLERVQALVSAFTDVEVLPVGDLRHLRSTDVPRDGRCNVLVSNHHARYGAPIDQPRIDLHLVLWNPFQVFDIAAPAVVTWGYAEGALAALKDWLEGRIEAHTQAPVPLRTAPVVENAPC